MKKTKASPNNKMNNSFGGTATNITNKIMANNKSIQRVVLNNGSIKLATAAFIEDRKSQKQVYTPDHHKKLLGNIATNPAEK